MHEPTRFDHAAALLDATTGYIGDSTSGFSRAGGLAGIRKLAESVIAERDALRAYALWLEEVYVGDHATPNEHDDALRSQIRAEHGVSELLRDT